MSLFLNLRTMNILSVIYTSYLWS